MRRSPVRPISAAGLFGDASAPTPREPRVDVLMVCTGNICRSPLAEKLLRVRARGLLSAASAGTSALVGAGMDAEPARWAAFWHAPAEHAARQLTGELVDEARLVLTMTREQRALVLRERASAQPKTFTLAEFERQLREHDAPASPLSSLIENAAERRRDDPADDVEDPYRRSSDVHEQVARRISALVDAIVERIDERDGSSSLFS